MFGKQTRAPVPPEIAGPYERYSHRARVAKWILVLMFVSQLALHVLHHDDTWLFVAVEGTLFVAFLVSAVWLLTAFRTFYGAVRNHRAEQAS
jgi:hypothetical protein